MVYKYQIGGPAQPQSANPELDKIFSMIDTQPEQAMQAIMEQGNVTVEQAAQVVALGMKQGKISQASAQKAIQILQAMRPKNRLGAKLNYIKLLKNDCPEGFEVKYFKEGGRVCKKCIERAAGGEKVKDGKKEIAEFKKACKGRKFEEGGKPQKPKKVEQPKKAEQPKKPAKLQKPIVNKDDTVHVNGKPFSITYSDGIKKNPKSPYPKYSNQQYINDRGTKDDKEAQKRVKKVDRVTQLEEMKCGGKAKKHQFGGLIKRTPSSYQGGTRSAGKSKEGVMKYGYSVKEATPNSNFQVETFSSAPDKFGRHVEIDRTITPRMDGSLKNDTAYHFWSFGNGRLNGDTRQYKENGKVYSFNGQKVITPGQALGRNQFNNWGEYFEYLLSKKRGK